MNTSKILFSLFLVLSLLVSCEKDNNHSEDDELATRMNQFIQSNLSTFYLWYDEIPNIKPESKKDPKEYFKALLSSKDKWSLITDDANGLLEEMAEQVKLTVTDLLTDDSITAVNVSPSSNMSIPVLLPPKN